MRIIENFLHSNGFEIPDAQNLRDRLLDDMCAGLEQNTISEEPMIVTSSIPKIEPVSEKIIVIDAGGTNFRSALINFDESGNYSIEHIRQTTMPGTGHKLSKTQFYDQIASNIDYLKNYSDKIGFCFSYALESMPDGDARIIAFSKEIKADEAVGSFVGRELKLALENRGWKSVKSIKILNDTTAALLSGVVMNKDNNYSSYAGFILGTGINNAYLEPSLDRIVVCECGMFRDIKRSNFDVEVDNESQKPGHSPLEKMCSGVYMGKLCYKIIKTACFESLFSEKFISFFKKVKIIDTADISFFLENNTNPNNILGLMYETGNETDRTRLIYIVNNIVERTASIVSAVLSATISKCASGELYLSNNISGKVCVVCNGSTFWKTTNLYQTVCNKIKKMTDLPPYELIKIENDITLGTAIAAL